MQELPIVDDTGLEAAHESERVVEDVDSPPVDAEGPDDVVQRSADMPIVEEQPVAAPLAEAAGHAPSKLLVFLPKYVVAEYRIVLPT